MDNDDLPKIIFCEKYIDVPKDFLLWPYTPTLALKGPEDPVHQVVRAALREHAAKHRQAPRQVWIWGTHVFVPAYEPEEGASDGKN